MFIAANLTSVNARVARATIAKHAESVANAASTLALALALALAFAPPDSRIFVIAFLPPKMIVCLLFGRRSLPFRTYTLVCSRKTLFW